MRRHRYSATANPNRAPEPGNAGSVAGVLSRRTHGYLDAGWRRLLTISVPCVYSRDVAIWRNGQPQQAGKELCSAIQSGRAGALRKAEQRLGDGGDAARRCVGNVVAPIIGDLIRAPVGPITSAFGSVLWGKPDPISVRSSSRGAVASSSGIRRVILTTVPPFTVAPLAATVPLSTLVTNSGTTRLPASKAVMSHGPLIMAPENRCYRCS